MFEEIPAYEIPVTDFGGLDEETRRAELADLRERLSHQVLDADAWPLFDVRISLLGGGRARIHLCLDFLVADAWSYFQVLVPDLVTYYAEPDAELAPLELTFRDYVLAVGNSLRDSELYRRSEWYWRDRLATLPPAPSCPPARPTPRSCRSASSAAATSSPRSGGAGSRNARTPAR